MPGIHEGAEKQLQSHRALIEFHHPPTELRDSDLGLSGKLCPAALPGVLRADKVLWVSGAAIATRPDGLGLVSKVAC